MPIGHRYLLPWLHHLRVIVWLMITCPADYEPSRFSKKKRLVSRILHEVTRYIMLYQVYSTAVTKGWFPLATELLVGVVIRSVERYDLVKIKPTESEAEH